MKSYPTSGWNWRLWFPTSGIPIRSMIVIHSRGSAVEPTRLEQSEMPKSKAG